ncbi:MAG: tRNA 2-thiouridine(34) synthase MnmA [Arenimonas sp.]|jgi:tRNA-specific 2-thiouridylase|uniref:tRNA 2-thiouridine(34) synthase MnmA n=1 Tax=Arenimonas sp. TaxID=1872635 RepID=UPI001B565570|nr:tRNA 2-thiouridine(34) synthase MnmA [Arenimonas sp.]
MKIMLGVSGGVDSSVAALLLKQQGHDVSGLFMQNWDEEDDGECRAEEDRKDALAVCGKLGIPFYSRNFAKTYWSEVFTYFLSEYQAGRTPNPDVLCNREIKFKTFLDEAKTLGSDKIATGHYAQVRECDEGFQLIRGADIGKDQTYFLHQLGQVQLAATLFPIGHLPKSEVRMLAASAGFGTATKKDSTGICFIGERDFRDFLGQYIPAKAGEIHSVDGQIVGEHAGVFYYTLGQREGLHIGGIKGRPAAPWFVVGKDILRNILYVDQGIESQWLHSRSSRTETAHWVAGTAPAAEFRCTAKTRYRQQDVYCTVQVLSDGTLEVLFDEPQRAVTPGQSLVLYANEVCLGGAVIAETDAPMEIRIRQETTA